MINIFGGTYYENCQFPKWDELYGSGLRACLALEKLTSELSFYTFLPDKVVEVVKSILQSNSDHLTYLKSDNIIEFYYLHGLSAPLIKNEPTNFNLTDKISVDKALVFGMLEGEYLIEANKVVYDPQAPLNPIQFNANGSVANELALVLNSYEARSLSGLTDIESAGKKLLNSASVVIIKQGSFGASVFTGDGIKTVPAFKTDKVFSIGSGDIFSSVFAYYWLEEEKPPEEAALLASRSTALFCQSRTLPLERKSIESEDFLFPPIIPKVNPSKKEYDVYLAGPFFNISEYWLVNDIRTCLQNMGLSVFSPIHDVGLGDSKDVAPKDIEALKNSRLIFAIADGLDTGTIFEVGYAQSEGIPVIVYSTLKLNHNKTMLEGTGCEIYNDLTTAVYKSAWKLVEEN